MKAIYGLLSIFLLFGFLMVPTGIFAQETGDPGSESISKYISSSTILENGFNSFNPQVKGGKSSSSSSSSSSSKKIKVDSDDDTTDGSGDDTGSYWWIIPLIIIGIVAVIVIWYFFIRK